MEPTDYIQTTFTVGTHLIMAVILVGGSIFMQTILVQPSKTAMMPMTSKGTIKRTWAESHHDLCWHYYH